MADNGKLLAVGILFIAGLYLFLASGSYFVPETETNILDNYPYKDNWSENGTLSGDMVDNSGVLTLSNAKTSTYTLDKHYVSNNSTLTFDNIIVNTDLKDDNDEAEIRVYGIDRNGTIKESHNILLKEGTRQYDLTSLFSNREEFEGYYFQIVLESSDNKYPEITRTSIEYQSLKPVSDNDLLNNILPLLMLIIGIGILFIKR